jgi:diguanylate cyclase (GGDEF)-like protein
MRRAPFSIIVLIAFLANTFGPLPLAQAQELRLPAPGVMVRLSPPVDPPLLKGIKVHPNNPFQFDFILDQGDYASSVIAGAPKQSQQEQVKEQAAKLIKYFLASLTVPEKDLWVNLSPYEKERIIPQSFGLTEMGRDLLAEDYMLKQITASLIYPEDEVGKKFWKRIYEEAAKKFGTTNIPVNTFNKVWIVPEKAVVYENAKAGTAYVVESKLKVMLEQDYLSIEKHAAVSHDVASVGADIVREIVIPELTKEVNTGKNFTQLRQVYNSFILATWYKKKIKDSILAQVYEDKNKVAGILSSPNAFVGDPQHIYQQYLQAFKKGVFNYIKEENDSLSQQTIPRKYFSGGVDFGETTMNGINRAMISTNVLPNVSLRNLIELGVEVTSAAEQKADKAMLNKRDIRALIHKLLGNSLQPDNSVVLPSGADVLGGGEFLFPPFRNFKVEENAEGKLIKASPEFYTYEDTDFERLQGLFHIMDQIKELDGKRADKTQPIIIVDWGCGTGLALGDLRRAIDQQRIPNVELFGFGNQYYSQWRKAPQGVHFILNTPTHLKEYLAKYAHQVQLIYSVYGLEHLEGTDVIKEHFTDLRDLLDFQVGRLLVGDASESQKLIATTNKLFTITGINTFMATKEIGGRATRFTPTEWRPVKSDAAMLPSVKSTNLNEREFSNFSGARAVLFVARYFQIAKSKNVRLSFTIKTRDGSLEVYEDKFIIKGREINASNEALAWGILKHVHIFVLQYIIEGLERFPSGLAVKIKEPMNVHLDFDLTSSEDRMTVAHYIPEANPKSNHMEIKIEGDPKQEQLNNVVTNLNHELSHYLAMNLGKDNHPILPMEDYVVLMNTLGFKLFYLNPKGVPEDRTKIISSLNDIVGYYLPGSPYFYATEDHEGKELLFEQKERYEVLKSILDPSKFTVALDAMTLQTHIFLNPDEVIAYMVSESQEKLRKIFGDSLYDELLRILQKNFLRSSEPVALLKDGTPVYEVYTPHETDSEDGLVTSYVDARGRHYTTLKEAMGSAIDAGFDAAMLNETINGRLEGAKQNGQIAVLYPDDADERGKIIRILESAKAPFIEITQDNFVSVVRSLENRTWRKRPLAFLVPADLKFGEVSVAEFLETIGDSHLMGTQEIADVEAEALKDPQFSIVNKVSKAQGKSFSNSEIDDLTKLNNRRGFIAKARRFITTSIRQSGKVHIVMLMIDVDYFKAINDLFGHGVGDEVLKSIADNLSASTRFEMDIIGRMGGEEFVGLLPVNGIYEGYKRIHRTIGNYNGSVLNDRNLVIKALRAAMETNSPTIYNALIFQLSLQNSRPIALLEQELPDLKTAVLAAEGQMKIHYTDEFYKFDGWRITASMGVTEFNKEVLLPSDQKNMGASWINDFLLRILSRADKLLYEAKRGGRNRIRQGNFEENMVDALMGITIDKEHADQAMIADEVEEDILKALGIDDKKAQAKIYRSKVQIGDASIEVTRYINAPGEKVPFLRVGQFIIVDSGLLPKLDKKVEDYPYLIKRDISKLGNEGFANGDMDYDQVWSFFTTGVLASMIAHADQIRGSNFVDFGAGFSGILAVAAEKMGAAKIILIEGNEKYMEQLKLNINSNSQNPEKYVYINDDFERMDDIEGLNLDLKTVFVLNQGFYGSAHFFGQSHSPMEFEAAVGHVPGFSLGFLSGGSETRTIVNEVEENLINNFFGIKDKVVTTRKSSGDETLKEFTTFVITPPDRAMNVENDTIEHLSYSPAVGDRKARLRFRDAEKGLDIGLQDISDGKTDVVFLNHINGTAVGIKKGFGADIKAMNDYAVKLNDLANLDLAPRVLEQGFLSNDPKGHYVLVRELILGEFLNKQTQLSDQDQDHIVQLIRDLLIYGIDVDLQAGQIIIGKNSRARRKHNKTYAWLVDPERIEFNSGLSVIELAVKYKKALQDPKNENGWGKFKKDRIFLFLDNVINNPKPTVYFNSNEILKRAAEVDDFIVSLEVLDTPLIHTILQIRNDVIKQGAMKMAGVALKPLEELNDPLMHALYDLNSHHGHVSEDAQRNLIDRIKEFYKAKLAEEVRQLITDAPSVKSLASWSLKGQEEKITAWLFSPEPLPDTSFFQTLLQNISTNYSVGNVKFAEAWLKIFAQKWNIPYDVVKRLVAGWLLSNKIIPKDVSQENLAHFFGTFIKNYRQHSELKVFTYNLPPNIDGNEKLQLAVKNTERMMKLVSPEFVKNNVVLKAPIEGSDAFIGFQYGMAEGTDAFYLTLGRERNDRLNPLKGVFFRIGLDTQDNDLRIIMMQGVKDMQEEINRIFPQQFGGLHPAMALMYVALEFAKQGHLKFGNDPTPFERLMGILPDFMPNMKNGNPTIKIPYNYITFGLSQRTIVPNPKAVSQASLEKAFVNSRFPGLENLFKWLLENGYLEQREGKAYPRPLTDEMRNELNKKYTNNARPILRILEKTFYRWQNVRDLNEQHPGPYVQKMINAFHHLRPIDVNPAHVNADDPMATEDRYGPENEGDADRAMAFVETHDAPLTDLARLLDQGGDFKSIVAAVAGLDVGKLSGLGLQRYNRILRPKIAQAFVAYLKKINFRDYDIKVESTDRGTYKVSFTAKGYVEPRLKYRFIDGLNREKWLIDDSFKDIKQLEVVSKQVPPTPFNDQQLKLGPFEELWEYEVRFVNSRVTVRENRWSGPHEQPVLGPTLVTFEDSDKRERSIEHRQESYQQEVRTIIYWKVVLKGLAEQLANVAESSSMTPKTKRAITDAFDQTIQWLQKGIVPAKRQAREDLLSATDLVKQRQFEGAALKVNAALDQLEKRLDEIGPSNIPSAVDKIKIKVNIEKGTDHEITVAGTDLKTLLKRSGRSDETRVILGNILIPQEDWARVRLLDADKIVLRKPVDNLARKRKLKNYAFSVLYKKRDDPELGLMYNSFIGFLTFLESFEKPEKTNVKIPDDDALINIFEGIAAQQYFHKMGMVETFRATEPVLLAKIRARLTQALGVDDLVPSVVGQDNAMVGEDVDGIESDFWAEGSGLIKGIISAYREKFDFKNEDNLYVHHFLYMPLSSAYEHFEQSRRGNNMSIDENAKIYDDLNIFQRHLERFSNYANREGLMIWSEKFLANYANANDQQKNGLNNLYHAALFLKKGQFTPEFAAKIKALSEFFENQRARILTITHYLTLESQITTIELRKYLNMSGVEQAQLFETDSVDYLRALGRRISQMPKEVPKPGEKIGDYSRNIDRTLRLIRRSILMKTVVPQTVQTQEPANDNKNNKAMISNTGGIDLTAGKTPLEIQNSGEGIKFHLDPAQLAALRNAPGFTPVIISVQPMTDLKRFLGIDTSIVNQHQ